MAKVVTDRDPTWDRIPSPHTSEPMKRKWEAKLKQFEEQASRYERNPLTSPYRPRLFKPDPSPVWELFPRQAQAFNFVKSCKEDVHVFALEHEVGGGQRIYLVTTYVQFWFHYKSRKNLLHCYEVIPENAVCKLYFDLEFNKLVNPGADGKKMVALLIEILNSFLAHATLLSREGLVRGLCGRQGVKTGDFHGHLSSVALLMKKRLTVLGTRNITSAHVCKALQELYGVNCSAEDVFNLDSSTDEKFSRHLIFQLRDVAFKDNIHAGNFVRTILQPAFHLLASEDEEDAGEIPETAGHGSFHSSETPVQERTSCSSVSAEKDRGESWTCNSKRPESLGSAKPSGPDLSFLVVKNTSGKKCLFVDLGVYTRNRNFRLYKSSKIGKLVVLEIAEDNKFSVTQSNDISEENQYFLSSLVSNVRFSDTLRILTCDTPTNKQKHPGHFNSTSASVASIEGFQGSPYPESDQFVLSLVNKNGIKGGIRCWNYFFQEQLLVYDICKYRWCGNIGRAHKSNNIMIVVDLKNEVWYQKCHDPECHAVNFKSHCFPLPAEVCLSFLLSEEEEFTTDKTMNNETKKPQKPPCSTLSKTEFSDPDWDNGIDDAYFLEATEDAELAEAAENSVLGYNRGVDEVPGEPTAQVLQE